MFKHKMSLPQVLFLFSIPSVQVDITEPSWVRLGLVSLNLAIICWFSCWK